MERRGQALLWKGRGRHRWEALSSGVDVKRIAGELHRVERQQRSGELIRTAVER